MKYLLFIYPADKKWNKDQHNKVVGEELSTIVESKEVKFAFGDNHTIFHFDSNLSHQELEIFLDLLKDDVPEFMYFIVEDAKNVASNMDKNHLDYLMDLENKSKKKNRIRDIFKNFEEDWNLYNLSKIINNGDYEFLKEETCDLTIDEILDKIIDQGIESLTNLEKSKLDEYSKQ